MPQLPGAPSWFAKYVPSTVRAPTRNLSMLSHFPAGRTPGTSNPGKSGRPGRPGQVGGAGLAGQSCRPSRPVAGKIIYRPRGQRCVFLCTWRPTRPGHPVSPFNIIKRKGACGECAGHRMAGHAKHCVLWAARVATFARMCPALSECARMCPNVPRMCLRMCQFLETYLFP